MKSSEKKYFPMFVDLTDKKVVVAGARDDCEAQDPGHAGVYRAPDCDCTRR